MNEREQVLSGAGLGVRFTWRGDRFGHEVFVGDQDGTRVLLTSLEGSPQDDWPPSPPFQSLHVESRGRDRQVALLVGMAGKSHWSASVEVDAQRAAAIFDVACRVRSISDGALASTYRMPPALRAQADGQTVLVGSESNELVISLSDEAAAGRVETISETLRIFPAINSAPTAANATIRWYYEIRRRKG